MQILHPDALTVRKVNIQDGKEPMKLEQEQVEQ